MRTCAHCILLQCSHHFGPVLMLVFGGDCSGIDQTRGWFYTLMVLSTALFGKPAFKSLVCNGLILAEDGKKMSKRLQNYPVSLTACNG